MGLTFGFGHTDATLDTLGSTATIDTYSPGIYASYADKGWYANALASYGFSSYTEDRTVAIGGFNAATHGAPSGDQIIGNLDGGYDFHFGGLTIGPTAGLEYAHLDVNGFSENGGGDADLNVSRDERDSLRSRHERGIAITPHFDASWLHEFLDQSRGVNDQFNTLAVGSFNVRTSDASRDSALVDLGVNADINQTVTVFSDYTVQAGQENYFGQSVQAGVKVKF